MTVIFSDMPGAMFPLLLVLMVKPGSSGGRMVILCCTGARLMILRVVVYDLSSSEPENLISGGSMKMKAFPVVF